MDPKTIAIGAVAVGAVAVLGVALLRVLKKGRAAAHANDPAAAAKALAANLSLSQAVDNLKTQLNVSDAKLEEIKQVRSSLLHTSDWRHLI